MSATPLVVVTDYLNEDSAEAGVFGPDVRLTLLQALHESEVVSRAADADALMVYHDMRISAASLERLPRCKAVVRCGVGFDNIDLAAAGRLGIVVCNTPDYGTEDVADHAIMMLLAIVRRLHDCHTGIAAGGWEHSWYVGTPRLRGRTLGLIGCGRIGTAVALRARAFGLRVVIYDPYQPSGYEKAIGVERCHRLEDLLPQCQFVSVHCPLTPETRHILNSDSMNRLPMGAYLVNTARGPCVSADAVVAALESGRLAAAALDVFEREPLDDDRLRRHPRVLMSPHSAYYSVEAFHEMRTKSAAEARRAVLGEPVRNPVNRGFLINPRCRVGGPAV